jgi:hypothetical protein
MSNVLSEEKKQQVIALGKLGWPLRRIEQATGVRRETASAYLKSKVDDASRSFQRLRVRIPEVYLWVRKELDRRLRLLQMIGKMRGTILTASWASGSLNPVKLRLTLNTVGSGGNDSCGLIWKGYCRTERRAVRDSDTFLPQPLSFGSNYARGWRATN